MKEVLKPKNLIIIAVCSTALTLLMVNCDSRKFEGFLGLKGAVVEQQLGGPYSTSNPGDSVKEMPVPRERIEKQVNMLEENVESFSRRLKAKDFRSTEKLYIQLRNFKAKHKDLSGKLEVFDENTPDKLEDFKKEMEQKLSSVDVKLDQLSNDLEEMDKA